MICVLEIFRIFIINNHSVYKSMPSAVGNFLKNQDQLGSGISLNYRGESGFGTILGGCLSLSLSLFIASFMML